MKKVERQAPAAARSAATAAQPVTLYMGPVEIRKFGQGNAEELLLYPHPSIRIQKTKDGTGATVTRVSTLHRDALGSVRAVTTAAGARAEKALYRPYGEEVAQSFDLVTAPETKGFIGERFDAEVGLQYPDRRPHIAHCHKPR